MSETIPILSNQTKAKKRATRKPKSSATESPRKLALFGAGISIGLSVLVLGISMPHLADGVSRITDCHFATAVFMACVFDLSQLAAEYTSIVIPLLKLQNRKLHWAAVFIMVSCTLVSMALNITAFSAGAETLFETVMAWVWGILLPILVLLLCFIASVFIVSLATPAKKK